MPPKPRIVCRRADGSTTTAAAAAAAALECGSATERTGSTPIATSTALRLGDFGPAFFDASCSDVMALSSQGLVQVRVGVVGVPLARKPKVVEAEGASEPL